VSHHPCLSFLIISAIGHLGFFLWDIPIFLFIFLKVLWPVNSLLIF
jgi:hypothetical protein